MSNLSKKIEDQNFIATPSETEELLYLAQVLAEHAKNFDEDRGMMAIHRQTL